MLDEGAFHLAAHLFQPARLTLARELRGLTKNDVAILVERSASAISQFESGRLRPDAGTLLKLALALGVPPGFFAHAQRSPLITIEACHFRSLRSASQRLRRRLLASGTLLADLITALEQYVDFPKEEISTAAGAVDPESSIEECARTVRKAWGLGMGPIPSVVQLLESKGVIACSITGDAREVDAFSFWNVGRPFLFLLMDKDSRSRARWDAAHELGHLIMHADVQPGNPDAERQANEFGAAFLLPCESFAAEAPRRLDWDHLRDLKRRWRVSYRALVRRAHDLGRLSDASYQRAFIHLNSTQGATERDEPSSDPPRIVQEAFRLALEHVPTEQLAVDLGANSNLLEHTLALVGLPSEEFSTLLGRDESSHKPVTPAFPQSKPSTPDPP